VIDASVPDWINAIAAAVGALAVVAGLFGANRKINEGRELARQQRRASVAEELISVAYNVGDAFKTIRSPLSTIPKDKIDDKLYGLERRYEGVMRYNTLFEELRQANIRARTVIGDENIIKAVDGAVDDLFRARNEVLIALEEMACYARGDEDPDRERGRELRSIMFSHSRDDLIGERISSAVTIINERLGPIARMDAKT
jgi:hypothetical protein